MDAHQSPGLVQDLKMFLNKCTRPQMMGEPLAMVDYDSYMQL